MSAPAWDHFTEWAEGRSQLEILRRGWPDAGPWERCTWEECPARAEYPEHCYAVISSGSARIHVHVWVDVPNQVQNVLHIMTVPVPEGKS